LIPYLNDDDHERLWRICDQLVNEGGARAAILCDAENGSVVISVGDAGAAGSVSSVEKLAPGERLVHGAAGEIYGVDVPGGGLLAVLHDPPALEKVRAAAAEAVRNMANLLVSLPPPPRPIEHVHVHEHASKTKRKTRTSSKPRTKTGTRTRAKPKTRTRTKKKGRTRKARSSKKRTKKRR
jgi:hypothetical protein